MRILKQGYVDTNQIMLRTFYRFLYIAIGCILALGNRAVHAQNSNDVCVTKSEHYEGGMAFSPDNKYFIASWDDEDGTVRLWNIKTGRVMQTFSDNVSNLGITSRLAAFAFSSDSKYLFAWHTNTDLGLFWEIQTGNEIYKIEYDGQPYSEGWPGIYITSDDKYIYIIGDYGLRVHSFKTGKQLLRFLPTSGRIWLNWAKDDNYVIMNGISQDGAILWNIRENKKVRTFEDVMWAFYTQDKHYIETLTITDTDNRKQFRYTLWDATTYRLVKTLEYSDDVHSWTSSPNGKYLLTNSRTSVTLWDVLKGHLLHTFTDFVDNPTFTSDSRYLVIANADPNDSDRLIYRMWDIKLNKERSNFQIKDALYTNLNFTPDGRYVLIPVKVAENSLTYRLWDIKLNQEKLSIPVDNSDDEIQISLDGNYVAIGSVNGELHLWNLQTGEEMHLDC